MAPTDSSGGYYPAGGNYSPGGYQPGGYRPPADPNYDPSQVVANSENQAVNQAHARFNGGSIMDAIVGPAYTEVARQRGLAAGRQQLEQHSAQLAASLDTRSGPPLANTNYLGMSHQQLYDSVHNNISPSQIGETSAAWTRLGSAFDAIGQQMNQASNNSASGWTGAAADNARQLHSAAAQWSANASTGAQLAATNLAAQSAAAQNAQNAVQPPKNFGFWDTVKDVGGAMLNPAVGAGMVMSQLADQDSAHNAAAQAVQAYDQNLGQSSQQMPAVGAPPSMNSSSGGNGGTGSGGGGYGPNGGGGYGPSGGFPGGSAVHLPSPNAPGMPNTGTTAQGAYPGAPTPSPMQGGAFPGAAATDQSGGYGGYGGAPVGGMPMGGYGGAEGYRGGSGIGRAGGYSAGGMGGEPSGARSGIAGGAGAAAEEAAMSTSAAGARGAAGQPGMGGPMGGGRGQRGGEDSEHRHASYLIEPDANSIFGTDQKTVPPVIGA